MKPKKRTPKKDPTPSVTLSEQEKQLVTALLDAINHSDPAEIAAGIPDVRCARVFLGLIPLDHSSTPYLLSHVEETSFLRVPLTDGQMETLLNQPLMKAWLIELEPLRPFMKEIMESGDSPLILSPGQKTQRITEIKNRCAVQLFPREKRQLIKGRLEEMAYMFHQLDKETECTGLCLRAAASMDEEVSEIRPNRFLAGLVDRSMAFYFDQSRDAVEAEEEENNHASSSILIP
ncbi:MAG: hypothetical protein R6U38_14980 [Desulfatiglandaceae bacterium]